MFGAGGFWRGLLLAGGLLLVGLLSSVGPAGAQAGSDWLQLGPDIDGEANSDESGSAIAFSADGKTVAIGAIGNDGNGGNSGHVRVYSWDGTSWVQVGADIDGEFSGDASGYSLAISADGATVAIGATLNDGSGTNAGHVRVYSWDGTSWVLLVQALSDINGELAGDQSGFAVALSADGQTLAVGAPRNDGNGSSSGHVRVYRWNGTSWVQGGLDIDGEAASDNAGWSVALSDDGLTLAVGAPSNGGNGADSGHVRVFRFQAGQWNQVGGDIDGEAASDNAGWSVALSADGETVAVGAPSNDGNGADSGHVRVHAFQAGQWNQIGGDIDGKSVGEESGFSVDLASDGLTVAIGAPFNDDNGNLAGQARVYELVGGNWNQVGFDIDGEAAGDRLGWSVALNDSGQSVAVGAPSETFNFVPGKARIFERAAVKLCNGLIVDVDLGAGDTPTAGDDVILGTDAADVITALEGDDTICGLGGDDTINGGPGDDWIDAGDGSDSVFGLDDQDEIHAGAGDDVVVGGNGNDVLSGAAGADTLNGGAGDDVINGGDGDDELFGQGGADTLNGDEGDDLLLGVDGIDTLNGGAGVDVLNGGPDDDTLNGDAGNDVMFGLAGDDVLNGGNDDDLVFGQLGADTIDGGLGDDKLWGNESDDTITDPSGTNILNGGPDNDSLTGGSGVDQIFGDGDVTQAGDDIIDGGLGADLLLGFAGQDTITANDGIADTVNGGPDADNCTTDAIDTVYNC